MPRFHPQVRRGVTAAIRHYDSISDALGDDFWAKFEQVCHQVETHPERFHFNPSGWHRANLEKFPYHLLFYEELDGARIMTLRHDRRNPSFALKRNRGSIKTTPPPSQRAFSKGGALPPGAHAKGPRKKSPSKARQAILGLQLSPPIVMIAMEAMNRDLRNSIHLRFTHVFVGFPIFKSTHKFSR